MTQTAPTMKAWEETSFPKKEIIIDTHFVIGTAEERRYKDVRIILAHTIDCEGRLEFEDCDIICDSFQDVGRLFFSKVGALTVADGGAVTFKNCNIFYNAADAEKYFIKADKAEILFEKCTFKGGRNLLYCSGSKSVAFISCSGNLHTPFVEGSAIKKFWLTSCIFAADRDSLYPVKSEYGNIKLYAYRALFNFSAVEVGIANTDLEGFTQGILCGEIERLSINESVFLECIGINRHNQTLVKLNDCKFDKCFPLLQGRKYRITSCTFADCYGKNQAESFRCEDTHFKGGIPVFHMPGASIYSEGKFTNCTFEEIEVAEEITRLNRPEKNEFQYISFLIGNIGQELFEDIDTLIDVGDSGKISGCKFKDIHLAHMRFMLSCSRYLNITNCIFDACAAKDSLLDKSVYTYQNEASGRIKERKASYYIKACEGLT